ncbi:MAG: DUF6891 domain-containing protein [Nocardioides sp.]|uniref:DUF6891 domain-containing protein n=1 Tax=Nocardioides sp. TaxID=35761 RepID=UPI003F0FF79D
MSADTIEDELRDVARLQVRTALLDPAGQLEALTSAVAERMPQTDPTIMARAWLAAARKDLVAEASTWPEVTDRERLERALAECEQHGVLVLSGVEEEAVRARLADSPPQRGVLWFTEPAAWRSVDDGVLALEVRRPDGTRITGEDGLGPAVLGCLARHDVRARVHAGRIEVAVRWQRRP